MAWFRRCSKSSRDTIVALKEKTMHTHTEADTHTNTPEYAFETFSVFVYKTNTPSMFRCYLAVKTNGNNSNKISRLFKCRKKTNMLSQQTLNSTQTRDDLSISTSYSQILTSLERINLSFTQCLISSLFFQLLC